MGISAYISITLLKLKLYIICGVFYRFTSLGSFKDGSPSAALAL